MLRKSNPFEHVYIVAMFIYQYGFVTPLTSMVVTMPKDLEDVKVSPPGLSDKADSSK